VQATTINTDAFTNSFSESLMANELARCLIVVTNLSEINRTGFTGQMSFLSPNHVSKHKKLKKQTVTVLHIHNSFNPNDNNYTSTAKAIQRNPCGRPNALPIIIRTASKALSFIKFNK